MLDIWLKFLFFWLLPNFSIFDEIFFIISGNVFQPWAQVPIFTLGFGLSRSKTDWLYSQHNVRPGSFDFYEDMHFTFTVTRGSSYRSDVAIDDVLLRPGRCQIIPEARDKNCIPNNILFSNFFSQIFSQFFFLIFSQFIFQNFFPIFFSKKFSHFFPNFFPKFFPNFFQNFFTIYFPKFFPNLFSNIFSQFFPNLFYESFSHFFPEIFFRNYYFYDFFWAT